MKHFLLCCYLLLFAADLKAGPARPTEIKEVDSLLGIISMELKNVNPSGALKPAIQALSLSRDANYSKGKAKSCFYIGQIFNYLGEYEKSMEYLSLSEQEKYSKNNATMLSEISRVKGQVYFLLGLNKASFNEFQKAHDYTVKITDKKERDRFTSLAYENLSIAYNIIRGIPDSSFYYMKRNEQLLATTDESHTFQNKINLYSLYGQYYTAQQQFDTAAYYFNKALSIISKYNYPYYSWLYTQWGDMYVKKGDSDSALIFYQKGLENIKRTNLKNELPPLYKKITDIYSGQGKQDSSRIYMEKYLQIDSEHSASRIRATEEALSIILKKEREQSFEKIQKFAWIVVVVLGIILSSTAVVYWQLIKKRKKKESEVSELKQKLNHTFEEVAKMARKNDPSFLCRFREVYPEFNGGIFRQHPDLTESDLQLSAMIFLNFTSKEIARYMFMTHRSVQTKKNRLRKKLDLPSGTDLYQYFKSLS